MELAIKGYVAGSNPAHQMPNLVARTPASSELRGLQFCEASLRGLPRANDKEGK